MYLITIYFIGGTNFSVELPTEENVLNLIKLIQDKKVTKDYNGIITISTNIEQYYAINVNNITNYTVKKTENKNWIWQDSDGKINKI